ncbi:uncharacterized protein [Drosophila takahashii]|uniref:uncharacterized protein n=1 Tax=Drosophila takahashii TaxID=29030 RepID=UPI0038993B18
MALQIPPNSMPKDPVNLGRSEVHTQPSTSSNSTQNPSKPHPNVQDARPIRGTRRPLAAVSLKAVETKKAIFVSRLRPDTTEDEVRGHLCDMFQVSSDNFIISKRDRPSRRGGGVLIAVKSDLSSQALSIADTADIEFIAHLAAIRNISSSADASDHLIILGDFNIPQLSWLPYDDLAALVPSDQNDFLDGLIALSLGQVNSIPNQNGRFLDLIFVSDFCDTTITRCTPLSSPEDPYHPTLQININSVVQFPNTSEKAIRTRCFRKVDYSLLSASLTQVDCYSYQLAHTDSIYCPVIDERDVSRSLSSIKLSYSPGPDMVPSSVLKYCADPLSVPLTMIFQKSIHLCTFPAVWKESFIIPLHKKGSKSDIMNYRGIAKLSAIPKLFEKLICDQLQHQCRSLLSPNQHGFTKCRSTTTNLLEFTTYINKGFLSSNQTDCVLRPQSTSTKLRVVFDASSCTSTQVALNDILMVGPTIQEELYSTLLWFRLHKFALAADVKKMYRQLNTVTYGTSPAPCLAIRCLMRLGEIAQDSCPKAAKVIQNDFYVYWRQMR